jgi:hypothetical protein
MVVAALILSGVGLGISTPAIAASVANAVEDAALGVASAALALLTQVGVVAGIQVMQTVQASSERAGSASLVRSFAHAYWVGAAVAVMGAVAGACLASTHRHSPLAEETSAIGYETRPAAAAELASVLEAEGISPPSRP